jgi:four helix bundle protein
MLRIYYVMIRVIAELKTVLVAIETCDRDLARQLRKAASSVALNIAEGSGSSGGTRRERYRNALGSAREVGACLDVAEAFGYGAVEQRVRDGLRQVQATLVRVI